MSVVIAAAQLYFQIREAKVEAENATKEASDAAGEARGMRQAIERTEIQLANNHLLFRAGEMERLRERLDRAVTAKAEADASQMFRDWPTFASDSIAILKMQTTDHKDAVRLLEDSIEGASRAKDRIIAQEVPLADATQEGRELIDKACTAVTSVASALKFTRSAGNA